MWFRWHRLAQAGQRVPMWEMGQVSDAVSHSGESGFLSVRGVENARRSILTRFWDTGRPHPHAGTRSPFLVRLCRTPGASRRRPGGPFLPVGAGPLAVAPHSTRKPSLSPAAVRWFSARVRYYLGRGWNVSDAMVQARADWDALTRAVSSTSLWRSVSPFIRRPSGTA